MDRLCQALIAGTMDFSASRRVRNKFWFFTSKFLVLCCSSPNGLKHLDSEYYPKTNTGMSLEKMVACGHVWRSVTLPTLAMLACWVSTLDTALILAVVKGFSSQVAEKGHQLKASSGNALCPWDTSKRIQVERNNTQGHWHPPFIPPTFQVLCAGYHWGPPRGLTSWIFPQRTENVEGHSGPCIWG